MWLISALQMACSQRGGKKKRQVSEQKLRVSDVPAPVSLEGLRATERHWRKLAGALWT